MQGPGVGNILELAKDDGEREARADAYRVVDPFASVPAGLLSSSEIEDYIRVTAMLDEFHASHVKSASYEVLAAGEFIYWEGDQRKNRNITSGDYYLTLPANSITFIQVKNYFRLPSYIAMRFNLRIAHVHRGLLLGTGPLVDPGFRGRLLIPLHNLTSSEYRIDLTKALIWIEFTKTTANFNGFSAEERSLHLPGRTTEAKPFPDNKINVPPDDYLFRANGGRPILSSIPEATDSAKKDAKVAREAVENLQRWARGIGVLTVLGAVVGIASVVTATWSAIRAVDNDIHGARTLVYEGNRKLDADAGKIAALEASVKRLDGEGRGTSAQHASPSPEAERVLQDTQRRVADLERALADIEARLRDAVAQPKAPLRASSAATARPRGRTPGRRRPMGPDRRRP